MKLPGFQFEKNIPLARTLPAQWYTDAEVFEREKTQIFGRTWQLVGRTEQAASAGDYFTADIAGEPVIVARGHDNKLRALSNVCRHRAGPVAEGKGNRKLFQCSYHGWTYQLDGRLLGTPDFEGPECFVDQAGDLPLFQVDTWGPLIFVKLEPGGPSLAEFLEDLPARIGRSDWSAMQPVARKDWYIECNWKVYVDNYLEGYHIPIVHPSLYREIDYSRYRTETRRYYSIQHSPIRRSGTRIAVDQSQPENEAQYFWIFPNLMLNFYPDNFSTNLIVPLEPGRTLTVFEWYFRNPELPETKQALTRTVEFSDEIQIEDIDVCQSVQRGLRSRHYTSGPYSPQRENGVHHFHGLLHEFYTK
ncbi:MAG TPA: SRPBCC family protein [Acidobacteriota bacterium]|jgi:choline monooxygenase